MLDTFIELLYLSFKDITAKTPLFFKIITPKYIKMKKILMAILIALSVNSFSQEKIYFKGFIQTIFDDAYTLDGKTWIPNYRNNHFSETMSGHITIDTINMHIKSVFGTDYNSVKSESTSKINIINTNLGINEVEYICEDRSYIVKRTSNKIYAMTICYNKFYHQRTKNEYYLLKDLLNLID